MKKLFLLALVVLLPGCMLTSGTTEYSIKPFETSKGETICCEAIVYNTKDYDGLEFKFKKLPDGTITMSLIETGVSASKPKDVDGGILKSIVGAL